MNKVTKIVVEVILLAAIGGLVYWLYSNIMAPVKFNKERDIRKEVAVQRLKDIRTLQVAYKSVTGKFNSSIDSLKQFYENGEMEIVMQIGSMDDSLAVANTEAIKKANRNLKGDQLTAKLQEAYAAGQNVVYSTTTKIPVRDTLFNGRQDFCIDSIKYIPFSGKPIEMESAIRMVSGVPVPLFEARIPWKILLVGMDNQLRVNLDAEMRDLNRYEGLQVGSVTAPNNNAGNWE
ncbi:hypothetical protein SAMN06298214_0549 [Bacteroidales bacterium WCE2004]|nr:hypothetical protein SAMN06298214_0549 [Bacteroidales bacterium WCE2004]